MIARARNGRLKSQSTYTVYAKHPSFYWFGIHYVATLTDGRYRLSRTSFRTGRYCPAFTKSSARVCRHMEFYAVWNADFSSMTLKDINRLELNTFIIKKLIILTDFVTTWLLPSIFSSYSR